MDFYVQARNKDTKAFIETMLPSMIAQLKLKNSKKTLFVKVSSIDIEGDNDGQTAYVKSFGSIIVIIKPQPRVRMGITLAHEMVHVKQIAKGLLKSHKGSSYWRGKKFSKRVKYLDQPWEVEAFSKQELIFRRAIE